MYRPMPIFTKLRRPQMAQFDSPNAISY